MYHSLYCLIEGFINLKTHRKVNLRRTTEISECASGWESRVSGAWSMATLCCLSAGVSGNQTKTFQNRACLLTVSRCQLTTILDLCFLLVLSVGDRGEWCVRLRLAQYLGDIHVELVTILSLDCKQLTKGRCCFLSSMNSYFIYFFHAISSSPHPHASYY